MRLRVSCFLCSAAGFEGCSMVPSIYPLETLHNSLSLKQVNEFLGAVCESAGDQHTRTTRGKGKNQCGFPRPPGVPTVTNVPEMLRNRDGGERKDNNQGTFLPAALTAMFASHNHPSVDSYIPQKVLSSSMSLRSRSDRPPWCEYGFISPLALRRDSSGLSRSAP